MTTIDRTTNASLHPVELDADTQTLGERIELGPDVTVTTGDIAAACDRPLRLRLTAAGLAGIQRSHDALREAHQRGVEIYGLTTGFGPHVRYCASQDIVEQGDGLIAHLGAGWGRLADRRVVRSLMLVRAQAIAQGCSGIAPEACNAFLALIEQDVVPAVPEIGSVGASGDLIPLAHVARVLTGVGRCVEQDGSTRAAADVLRERGLEPIKLSGRDALAIVNGTSFMTAYAALAVERAEQLIATAEKLTGWAFRMLGGRAQCLDERLHQARGHAGQITSARCISEEAYAQGDFEDTTRPLQEVYSLRCAPQILGAARDQIQAARAVIEREINGVNDNPVVWGEGEDAAVLHGGNFQGQQIAFAADMINAAITQTALLIERQLDVLCNPELNGDAPLLLAWQPGATSGLAGAQITATAIAAELRRSCQHSAVATMPTNGRNQDIVSMGTMAARVAYEQAPRAAAVLAADLIGLVQLGHLRENAKAPGRVWPRPQWCPAVSGFDKDRPLNDDLNRLSAWVLGEPNTDEARRSQDRT